MHAAMQLAKFAKKCKPEKTRPQFSLFHSFSEERNYETLKDNVIDIFQIGQSRKDISFNQ